MGGAYANYLWSHVRDVNKTFFQDQDREFRAVSDHFVKDGYNSMRQANETVVM